MKIEERMNGGITITDDRNTEMVMNMLLNKENNMLMQFYEENKSMCKINERIGERNRDRKIAKCYNAVMGFWIIARIACHVTDLTGNK